MADSLNQQVRDYRDDPNYDAVVVEWTGPTNAAPQAIQSVLGSLPGFAPAVGKTFRVDQI